MEVFDVIASRVHGVVTARDCRVVWTDGRLYVVRESGDVVSLECEVKPRRMGGGWQATLPTSIVTFSKAGCGTCVRRIKASAGGQMTVEQIVASVDSVDA